MGSRLSCLRAKHGSSMYESRNIVISLGKGNKRSSNAKKALICIKNFIERSACKLIKNYTRKSGSGYGKNKSTLKRACCACISSEKRTSLTTGLFKMKSLLLKGGSGDHGGSKGNNINGGKNGGGVNGKGAHDDQKKQK